MAWWPLVVGLRGGADDRPSGDKLDLFRAVPSGGEGGPTASASFHANGIYLAHMSMVMRPKKNFLLCACLMDIGVDVAGPICLHDSAYDGAYGLPPRAPGKTPNLTIPVGGGDAMVSTPLWTC